MTTPTPALWRGVADRLDAGRVVGVVSLLRDLLESADTDGDNLKIAGMALDRLVSARVGVAYHPVAVEEVADLIRWHAGIGGWERSAHRPGPWARQPGATR